MDKFHSSDQREVAADLFNPSISVAFSECSLSASNSNPRENRKLYRHIPSAQTAQEHAVTTGTEAACTRTALPTSAASEAKARKASKGRSAKATTRAAAESAGTKGTRTALEAPKSSPACAGGATAIQAASVIAAEKTPRAAEG